MNFRNKDLTQIFDETYKANHNQKLFDSINKNKKQIADRVVSSNKIDNQHSKKVIGYNNFSRK